MSEECIEWFNSVVSGIRIGWNRGLCRGGLLLKAGAGRTGRSRSRQAEESGRQEGRAGSEQGSDSEGWALVRYSTTSKLTVFLNFVFYFYRSIAPLDVDNSYFLFS